MSLEVVLFWTKCLTQNWKVKCFHPGLMLRLSSRWADSSSSVPSNCFLLPLFAALCNKGSIFQGSQACTTWWTLVLRLTIFIKTSLPSLLHDSPLHIFRKWARLIPSILGNQHDFSQPNSSRHRHRITIDKTDELTEERHSCWVPVWASQVVFGISSRIQNDEACRDLSRLLPTIPKRFALKVPTCTGDFLGTTSANKTWLVTGDARFCIHQVQTVWIWSYFNNIHQLTEMLDQLGGCLH